MGMNRTFPLRQWSATAAITALLFASINAPSGATVNKGTVTGNLRTFGGVAFTPRSGWPTAGRVVFMPEHGTARAIKVGKIGKFSVELKPGTYTVFGGPPSWKNTCQANGGKPFSLAAGQRIDVTVSCLAL
jgi:hypothetical protein